MLDNRLNRLLRQIKTDGSKDQCSILKILIPQLLPTLRTGINVRSGINILGENSWKTINLRFGITMLVGRFLKKDDTFYNWLINEVIFKPYQGTFYLQNKQVELLCTYSINVRSGIRSIRLGKSTKLIKVRGTIIPVHRVHY